MQPGQAVQRPRVESGQKLLGNGSDSDKKLYTKNSQSGEKMRNLKAAWKCIEWNM
jgi:hypothetical protein